MVPVLPEALHQKAMSLCHDSPTAGHQGTLKTLERIRQEAYWVNMAQDVDRHGRECVTCQKAKLPMPVRSTLTNIPIGRPWQMIAIDILEVPVSTKNNRYLLVIQDYFTKWADARPLKDQTAVRIKAEPVKLFCTYGIPEIVHSDQGRNFESSVVQSTLDAFGVVKSRTTPYHPQGDGMVERFTAVAANIRGKTGRLGTASTTGSVCIQNCYTHLHWSVPIPADVRKASTAKYHYPC